MEQPKDEYPWLTALKEEREKIIRNHQNRTIHFENPSFEIIFACGVMILGSGFFVSGFLGSFGTIEVGDIAGYLLGALLIYAGLLFLLSFGYDYGSLSAVETILSRARERKECTSTWLKEIINYEISSTRRSIFKSGTLSNILGLVTVVYGTYVFDLLLLSMLGISPVTKMIGVVVSFTFVFGGLAFFLIKEPYKRAKFIGYKRTNEIIHLSEHAPKPQDLEKAMGEEELKHPQTPTSEGEKIELHHLDTDEIDNDEGEGMDSSGPKTGT